jgi:NDP-hexose 4-ketoreductase
MPGQLLIAGANGWLGRAVRAKAERRGWEVVGVGRSASAFVDVVAGDSFEMSRVVAANAPTVVVNCIGVAGGGVEEMQRANVDLVRTLLEAADGVGARFVHVGSAAEIGDPGSDDRLAEGCVLAPISDYGRTKAQGSIAVVDSNVDAVVARVFNIAGPSPPDSSFLAALVAKVCSSGDSVVVGNAEMVRDWVSIDLVAEAIVALGTMRGGPRLVHVCSGRGISHGDLAQALGRRLGRRFDISSERMPGVHAVVGDPRLLHAVTGLGDTMTVNDLAKCILPRDV